MHTTALCRHVFLPPSPAALGHCGAPCECAAPSLAEAA